MEENLNGSSNIAEIKNKNDGKIINSNNILTKPEKCIRCRYNPVEIMCKECYPFIYFCSNCSQNLHSVNSKKNHQIIELNELNPDLFSENNINEEEEKILNEFNGDENINIKTKNYINDIKSLYLKEKNNFMKKSLNYEKEKSIYSKTINELKNKLSNSENNKNEEIKILEQSKNDEFKNILDSKDSKINFLLQKNEELNKYNEQLFSQISSNTKELNKLTISSINLKQIIIHQNSIIELLNKEKSELKEKMEKIDLIYVVEKKEMIKAYEEQIQKINKEYIQQKDKMKLILLQKENEINIIKQEFSKEINDLKGKLNDFKNMDNNMNKDYDELKNIINKQQHEIEDLKYKLNDEERKYIIEFEDKKFLKAKIEEYESSLDNLKAKNEYLNKIIYGKTKNKGQYNKLF